MKKRTLMLLGLIFTLSNPVSLYSQFGRLSEGFGVNKIQWNVENCDWQVLSTSRNSLYYCEGGKALAEMGLAYAESSYDTLKTLFGVEPEHPRRIIMYLPGHVQETNTWPGLVPEAVGGWYEDEDNLERTVAPFVGDYGWFRCMERHEMVHNFQGAIARKSIPESDLGILHSDYGVPLWWTEGEAEYRAGNHDICRGIDRDVIFRDLILGNGLPTFTYLSEYPWGIEHYFVGFETHRHLARNFGDSLNVLFYRNLKTVTDSVGETKNAFPTALKKTYGVDLNDLYLRFQHELRLKFYSQYDGTRLPIDLVTKPLTLPPDRFLKYASPIRLYESRGKTYVIFFSGYDGYPTLYQVELPRKDSSDSLQTDEKNPPRVLIRGGKNGYENISPLVDVLNDSLLLLAAEEKGSYALVIHDIKRGNEIFRRRFPNIQTISSPQFSPDGKQIVFSGSLDSSASDSSGVFDLYLYNREGNSLERMTHDIYMDGAPRWQPNGKLIVFESDRGEGGEYGFTNLFLLDSETKEIRYLTRGKQHDFYPSWSPDGKRVIFTSDRDGFYDLYEVDLEGRGRRLTKYWGSALFGHFLPNDSAIIFTGFYEGKRQVYVQKLSSPELTPTEESFELSPVDQVWHPTWQWEGRESKWYKDVVETPYRGEYRIEGFCGGELAAGYGYGTGCGIYVPDLMNDHWFFASFGKSNHSWVPGQGRFNSSVGFTNLGKRNDYALFLYYEDNPVIDIPIRHAFHETALGGGVVFSHPVSKYFRLENNWGLEHLNQRDLYDWTNSFDLNHSADTLIFKTKGLTLKSGISFVGDNALGIESGPIVGYRYRVGALATVNLSGLIRIKPSLQNFPELSQKKEETPGAITNYILHADLRHYIRLGLISTLGLRFYGYYSSGEIPTYVSFGKLNGMAAFYPWNSPYGGRGWMANSRITLPVLRRAEFEMPILGTISFSGIQGGFFFDFAQVWFRNNELGPIYGDLGMRIEIPLGLTNLQFDYGKMFTLPLKSGYELPEFYRKKKFGIGFGQSF